MDGGLGLTDDTCYVHAQSGQARGVFFPTSASDIQSPIQQDVGVISLALAYPVVPADPSAARTIMPSRPPCLGTTIRRSGRHAMAADGSTTTNKDMMKKVMR
jgi:hypothetical protein